MQSPTPAIWTFGLLLWIAAPTGSAAMDSRFVGLDPAGNLLADGTAAGERACIKDKNSGLVWEARTRDSGPQDYRHTYTWRDTPSAGGVASCPDSVCNTDSYAAALSKARLCGISDWRLPTREELRSLVDYQRPYPGPAIASDAFPNTAAQFHWAAEPDASDTHSAWGIGFVFGFDYAYPRNNVGHVRLVHGATPARAAFDCKDGSVDVEQDSRFVAQPDGTLQDRSTGLVWNRCALGQTLEGGRCLGTPRPLTRFEAGDPRALGPRWRLPTLSELASIVDLSCTRPALRADAFPQTPAADFWTSTPFAGRESQHWVVNFTYGESVPSENDQTAFVRAVRVAPTIARGK
jgi:hypothetical protein